MYKISSRKIILFIIFFFGFPIFYYVKDIYVLYVAAKVIVPTLAVSFSILFLVSRKRLDYFSVFLFFVWFYLTVISTIQAWTNFNQPPLIGLTAQVKLLPVFFYWCFLYLLYRAQPSEREINGTVLFLGWVSLLVYYYFNWFVDPALFPVGESSVAARVRGFGFLFQFPLEIIYLTVFIYTRRFISNKSLTNLLWTVPFWGFLIIYGNQRGQLMALSAVVFLSLVNISTRNAVLKVIQILLIISVFFIAVFGIAYIENAENFYSLGVRSNTAIQILQFFEQNPGSLFLGAGNLSPLNKILIRDIFSRSFFIADVGWLGFLFEFGLVGCILLAILYIRIFSVLKDKSVFVSAARDLVIMYWLNIIGGAFAYRIGMFMTILAVSVYLMQRQKQAEQTEALEVASNPLAA